VDDEPNILFALEETVRDLGFESIAACDGEDALVIARGVRPDLVITDVIMPRLNGYELCERLKTDEATRDIPVVMVTVRASDRDRKQGSTAGADAYLVKPFHLTDLKEIIDTLLPRAGS
jgi:DNA-binding response OmpR family regulator